MSNQKLENQLNLALDISEELRLTSENLGVGYDAADKRWELIVKYSGDLSRLASEEVWVEELIAGYAIVTLPERLLRSFSQLEEVEYIEKPKRIFPQVRDALAASCFNAVQIGEVAGGALNGEGVYIAVIDSGERVIIMSS